MDLREDVPRRTGFAPALRHLRGTLFVNSLAELRTRGFEEAYRRVLDPSAAHVLLGTITETWLPLSLGMAHFAACEAVVPAALAFEVGAASGTRVQESILSPLVTMAGRAGATPWTALAHYPRLWSRIFDGGSATVTKIGPKDALVTIDDVPLARFAYFRRGFQGTNYGCTLLFARTVFVNELPKETTATSFRFTIAWA